jgi:hypothetical protein
MDLYIRPFIDNHGAGFGSTLIRKSMGFSMDFYARLWIDSASFVEIRGDGFGWA